MVQRTDVYVCTRYTPKARLLQTCITFMIATHGVWFAVYVTRLMRYERTVAIPTCRVVKIVAVVLYAAMRANQPCKCCVKMLLRLVVHRLSLRFRSKQMPNSVGLRRAARPRRPTAPDEESFN